MRAKFPHYNYDDMVLSQYGLLTEGLHIRHLRLVLGNSMSGMHVWVWETRIPTSWMPLFRCVAAHGHVWPQLQALTHVRSGHLLLIPASADTRGHGTTALAKFWQQKLQHSLATVLQKTM